MVCFSSLYQTTNTHFNLCALERRLGKPPVSDTVVLYCAFLKDWVKFGLILNRVCIGLL